MTPDHTAMNRLTFIKHLYNIGQAQATQAPPTNAVAILSLHDSVELFLRLAATQQGVTKTIGGSIAFLEYWKLLKAPTGQQPTQYLAMDRLNRTRNSLKHDGIRPATEDVTELAGATALFFRENTPLFFGTQFEAISLTSLVTSPSARAHLESANGHREHNETSEALGEYSIAFAIIIDEHQALLRKTGASVFPFAPQPPRTHTLTSRVRIHNQQPIPDELVDFLDDLRDSIAALYDALAPLTLGLSMADLARFYRLTPHVRPTMNPDQPYQLSQAPAPTTVTATDLEFCNAFVINAGITLADLNARLTQPPSADTAS
jgi:hypothetical protein